MLSLASLLAAQKKTVFKIILQPGDIKKLTEVGSDYKRRDVSYYIRKFRKITVSDIALNNTVGHEY